MGGISLSVETDDRQRIFKLVYGRRIFKVMVPNSAKVTWTFTGDNFGIGFSLKYYEHAHNMLLVKSLGFEWRVFLYMG